MILGGRTDPAATPRPRGVDWLILAAAAALAMLPEFAIDTSISDSMRYNNIWTDQFRELFRAGDPYPRWLPASWDGLGSPTFYFYPPLFFWTAALADVATLGMLETGAAMTLASLALLAVSGLAMHRWLRSFIAGKAALIGALAYMLAPYHLYDIYGRGALAEVSAYAWLPLIMLAIRRIGEGRWSAILLLGASYGALLFSHLPVALLASLFAIPPYVAFTAWQARGRAPRVLGQALAGGLLGLGFACAYWLPAITLTRYISADALFGPLYDPANWFFWRPAAWPRSGLMLLILPLSTAALLLAGAAAIAARTSPHRREARLWVGVTLLSLAMISDALPFLWQLPFVALVQFPWRMFVVTEFALVTALALATPRLGLAFAGAAPLLGAAGVVVSAILFRVTDSDANGRALLAEYRADYRDAPEYLPAGSAIPRNDKLVPETAMVVLPRVPLAAAAGARAAVREGKGGDLLVEVAAPRATRVVVRRFYFPHWRVTSAGREIAVQPTPGSRLLSWSAPAGRSSYRVEPGAAPGERAAVALSLASLFVLLAGALFLLVRRAKDQRHFHDSRLKPEA